LEQINRKSILNLFDRRLKILILIAFLFIAWLAVANLFSDYIKSETEKNWDEISKEKNEQRVQIVNRLFLSDLDNLNELSNNISKNSEIIDLIRKSESKKLFETLINLKLSNNTQYEFYNSRLELLAFSGRKLGSDFYSLNKSINGKRFSVLKEIGFYTYLIIYSPVYDPESQSVIGVSLTAELIDIKYQIDNKFFKNSGLLYSISKETSVSPELFPSNVISGKIEVNSPNPEDFIQIDLKGLENEIIGVILIPKYNELNHVSELHDFTLRLNSILIFGLSVIIFLLTYKFIFKINSSLLKFILFSAVLIFFRYLWLQFDFPSKTFNSDLFSPGYYASVFGNGIAKSIGELFVTSVVVLIIALFGFNTVLRNKFVSKNNFNFLKALKIIFSVILFFALIYGFGAVIQSVVFDSNLKFFDKSNIIPGPELFFIQLVILILTVSFFIFLLSLIIHIYKYSLFPVFSKKTIRNFAPLFILLILLLINQIFTVLDMNFYINTLFRIIIIVSVFLFGSYLGWKLYKFKNYNVYSLKNFSVLILICIITIPGILLENITSQETRYVELIGNKIADKDDDKIKFLLLTELSDISNDKKIENNIRNKNKLKELGFSIWNESKFSEENLNTSVIILDTNRKVVSDFMFNSNAMILDSIIAFANKEYFIKKESLENIPDSSDFTDSLSFADDPENEEEMDFSEESFKEDLNNLFITDKILILNNEEENYYLGIVPVERVDLKNTIYETNLGYLLVAVQYESKNLLQQSSVQIFKTYSRDNLFDKLISEPVITEYVNGEIVSSTSRDQSKSNTLSLNVFRDAVKFKDEKSDWRYEVINNEKFRSFYILDRNIDKSMNERIYSVSLKRNDVKLTFFFYLKFTLFAFLIYMVVFVIKLLQIFFSLKELKPNFREKLFASFFFVSVIPIVLLALYTRSFIKEKYDINFQNQIISDLNLVSQSLKNLNLNQLSSDSLSVRGKKIFTANLFPSDKNFNLYINTDLVSTTNDELYKSDLLDSRVDAEAYYNINYMRKDFFIKNEEIGAYSFIVGYKPYFDQKNNVVGIMSSQTLYKQNELSEELTEILTFIFGIYLIVVIILLVFVSIMTDRFSQPIMKLKYATERISKGDSNVAIDIKRKDEIGNLVDSFNIMSRELESSKVKLKRAEREAAWRDIARRVAHEIKNPLTPMKLSIQHLFDVYENKTPEEFSEVLKKTRNIIINEIDKLNKIATEFSDFAKLPGKNYTETDLNEIIGEVISLYKLSPNIEFVQDLNSNIGFISADKQELNRVFQNLVKNSVQSIGVNGKIEISTRENGEYIIAEVKDNGCGIDPSVMKNLFNPNFSTKTTGMGLGLSITKKSLDDMKAEIMFESIVNKGTTVIIKFNKINSKTNNS